MQKQHSKKRKARDSDEDSQASAPDQQPTVLDSIYQMLSPTKRRNIKYLSKMPSFSLFKKTEQTDSFKHLKDKAESYQASMAKQIGAMMLKHEPNADLSQQQIIQEENQLFKKNLDLILDTTGSQKRTVQLIYHWLKVNNLDKLLDAATRPNQNKPKIQTEIPLRYFGRLKNDVQGNLDKFKKNLESCDETWQKHKEDLIQILNTLKNQGSELQTQRKVAMQQFKSLGTFQVLQNELQANIDDNEKKMDRLKNYIDHKQSRFELENEQSKTRQSLDNLMSLICQQTNEIIYQIKQEQNNPETLDEIYEDKISSKTMQLQFNESSLNPMQTSIKKQIKAFKDDTIDGTEKRSNFIQIRDNLKIELIPMRQADDEQGHDQQGDDVKSSRTIQVAGVLRNKFASPLKSQNMIELPNARDRRQYWECRSSSQVAVMEKVNKTNKSHNGDRSNQDRNRVPLQEMNTNNWNNDNNNF